MKNCFGYVRVSSHKQGEGVSLEAQKDAILRFAAQNEIKVIRWFEEQQTAAKCGRPVFNQMLKILRAGKAAGVVMHKIDRSARNFFDWAKIGELADSGIDVHFATESLDFHSRGGRLTANIQMAVAEDYVRNLRSEVLKGQRGQLERGFYPFSAPIGYQNNGKHALKTIDPASGPMVRCAFELYASGQYSLHGLRRELASRGLSKANGEPLSKGCVEKFLANPFYTGIIRIKRTGEIFQGEHEPLISAKLFERVIAVREGKSGKKLTRHNHLFRGLFRCGNCSRSMIPERQKAFVYYRCQFADCHGNCVREDRLAGAVTKVLNSVNLTDAIIAEIERRSVEWARKYTKSKNDRAEALRLAKLDERMEQLEDAAIAGIIDADNFSRRKRELLHERSALLEAIENAKRSRRDPKMIGKFLERLKNLSEHYEFADPTGKREIVEFAVSNRTVKDKKVFVEPSYWLAKTQDAVGFFSCAHARTTSRTFRHFEQLADIAKSPEVRNLCKMECRSSNN
ncbi:MAG: recombinase family protein [Hyphomicrobiales bacterium]|nr:recombinase family protein [Hyphomicrobiales bacterium]